MVTHATAIITENLLEGNAILQIDFENAFNQVDRIKVIKLAQMHFPYLSNIVSYLYSAQGYLAGGPDADPLSSCTGVQQGCPLGPFLFALVLREVTDRIHTEMPHLDLNHWYLDDGHLAGKSEDLLRCLEILRVEGLTRGLTLNLKSALYTVLEIYYYAFHRIFSAWTILDDHQKLVKFEDKITNNMLPLFYCSLSRHQY